MFPTLYPSSLQRIPVSMAFPAIVLPAQKRDGVPHVHAFVRIPNAARPDARSRLTIQEGGVSVEILAPKAVTRFVAHLRELAHGPSSLHLAHHNGAASNMATNQALLAGNLTDPDRSRRGTSELGSGGSGVAPCVVPHHGAAPNGVKRPYQFRIC